MSDTPKNPWPSGKFGRPDARPNDLVDQFEPGYPDAAKLDLFAASQRPGWGVV